MVSFCLQVMFYRQGKCQCIV